MNKRIGAIPGRFLLLLLYCSPLFLAGGFAAYYRAALAEELSVQFLETAYESGLTESAYVSFVKEEAKLGYTVTLDLEGRDRSLNHGELLGSFPVTIRKDEFLSCEISSGHGVIRTGGVR